MTEPKCCESKKRRYMNWCGRRWRPKKTNELNLIFVFVAHLLALVFDFLSSQTQTGAPFIQSDEVVVVHVARVEERADAVLERHQWGADREQFVAGHFSVFKNFQQLKLFFIKFFRFFQIFQFFFRSFKIFK